MLLPDRPTQPTLEYTGRDLPEWVEASRHETAPATGQCPSETRRRPREGIHPRGGAGSGPDSADDLTEPRPQAPTSPQS